MSLSPTIVVPLFTQDCRKFRIRTLLDPGSGTNWIVRSLLRELCYTTKGHVTLEVATFNGNVTKKFPLVEVYYEDGNKLTQALTCYVYDEFTRHVTVEGIVEYIRSKAPVQQEIFKHMVDPTTDQIDHGDKSMGIGMILCSTSINLIRGRHPTVLLDTLNILLEPTIFGAAISGEVPTHLRGQMNIIQSHHIAPRVICPGQDPLLFMSEENDSVQDNINFLWAQDTLGILPQEMHEDDKIAWDHFLESMSLDSSQ